MAKKTVGCIECGNKLTHGKLYCSRSCAGKNNRAAIVAMQQARPKQHSKETKEKVSKNRHDNRLSNLQVLCTKCHCAVHEHYNRWNYAKGKA